MTFYPNRFQHVSQSPVERGINPPITIADFGDLTDEDHRPPVVSRYREGFAQLLT